MASTGSAYAQNISADTVTANGEPPRWTSSSCRATLPELSDGSNANPGICLLGPVDPAYTITFTFSPANAQFMSGIEIWANDGRNMADNELRRLDVAVDYFDPEINATRTLFLDDVNIGDTLNFDDPKFVSFAGPGGSDLYQVSEVRISNLVGRTDDQQATFREVQGVFATLPVAPEISVSSSETGPVADGGTDAHGTETAGAPKTVTYTITNTGTDTLVLSGTPGVSNLSNIAGTVSVGAPGTLSLPPGGSTTFEVTYTPDVGGNYGFDIDVQNNDGDESAYDIAVSGTANEAPGVTLVAEPSPPTGPFAITATFTEPVIGMTLSDFVVTNGVASSFSNPSPGVYRVVVTATDPALPIGVEVPANAANDADGVPNTASNALGIVIASAPTPTELVVIEEIIIEETLRDLRNSITLNQRAVRRARDRHAGFLRCRNHGDDEADEFPADFEDLDTCAAVRGLSVEPTFDGKLFATEKSVTGAGSFFARKSSHDGTSRRLAFGEISFSRFDDDDVMMTLNGRVAWDGLVGEDVLRGFFIGASATPTDIENDFRGTRTGFGLNAGAYFVDQLDTNLFWDGFLSVGAGRNNLDLDNGALSVDGDYKTMSAEVGLALSGVRTFDRFEIHPELSIAYGVTSVGDVNITSSSISGTSEATISVGSVALGTIRFRPEIVIPGETDRFGTVRRSLSIAPSVMCETIRTNDSDSDCGGGLELEWTSRTANGTGEFSARAARETVGGTTKDQLSFMFERRF